MSQKSDSNNVAITQVVETMTKTHINDNNSNSMSAISYRNKRKRFRFQSNTVGLRRKALLNCINKTMATSGKVEKVDSRVTRNYIGSAFFDLKLVLKGILENDDKRLFTDEHVVENIQRLQNQMDCFLDCYPMISPINPDMSYADSDLNTLLGLIKTGTEFLNKRLLEFKDYLSNSVEQFSLESIDSLQEKGEAVIGSIADSRDNTRSGSINIRPGSGNNRSGSGSSFGSNLSSDRSK